MALESGQRRPPARLVVAAWGRHYVDETLSLTLPAVAAPGNLPALAQHYQCEVAFVTESSEFDRIRSHPVTREITRHAALKLIAVDDLVEVNGGYGLALTYALHRGFEDLGERMLDTYLLFLNADFIIADGSFRTMVQKMLAGERLIFAPSYCTVSEEVIPALGRFTNDDGTVLSAPKRSMASIALAHRHDTVWAKTVNRQLFRMHVSDQFYWYVDAHTLLGHQMPAAIVCMRPERVYTEPVCFWDYSTISMMCPTAEKCVLGDSDEFMMLELRTRATFDAHITLGKARPKEVAAALGAYMTADQFALGRYPLTLHSSDLGGDVPQARESLRAYVEEVYRHLPRKPVSPIDHRFWTGQKHDIEALKQQKREAAADSAYRQTLAQAKPAGVPPPPGAVEVVHPHVPRGIARVLKGMIVGRMPDVGMLHPYWCDLRYAVRAVREALDTGAKKILVLESTHGYLSRLLPGPGRTVSRMSPTSYLQYGAPAELSHIDLCVIDANWMEMNELPRLFGAVVAQLAPGARVVAYHSSPVLRSMNGTHRQAVAQLVPRSEDADVYFGGGPGARALLDRYGSLTTADVKRGGGALRHVCSMLRLMPEVLRVNRAARRAKPHEIVETCTSITVAIDRPGRRP